MEERKRFHFYSRFAKMTTLGLQVLCIAGFVLSVTLAGYVLNWVGSLEDITGENAYCATVGCAEQLALDIHENAAYGKYKVIFETDGSYDEDKTIDIMNPMESNPKAQNEQTSYTVKALRTMLDSAVLETINTELSMAYCDEVSGEVYFDGEMEDYTQDHWNSIIANQKTVAADTLGEVLEGQSSLYCYQYLQELQNALERLQIYLDGRNVNMDSNLKFFVRDTENGNVYTNVREWEKRTEMPNLLSKREVSTSVPILMSYTRTDGKIVYGWQPEDAAQHFLQEYFRDSPILSDNEEVIVALDISYSVMDDIKMARESYESYQPYFKFLIISAIICFVLWGGCLIIATIQTGKEERDGAIILGKFDRIPTEVAAFIAIVLGSCVLGIAVSVPVSYYSGTFLAVYESITITLGSIIFMWAYLSLVRRIKAKTLWKNSLVKSILDLGKRVYRARRSFERTCIIFVIFAFFHIVMIAAGGGFGVSVVVICDILALLHLAKDAAGKDTIKEGILRLSEGDLDYKIEAEGLKGENREMAEHINTIGNGMQAAVERAMKNERMKAELITNVSHDIKTPLTSIINYVDLLKRENLEDPKVRGYIDILDKKSQRLKQLTEDLIEASKASTGNIDLHMTRVDVQQLLQQAYGEFDEKLEVKGLIPIVHMPDEPVIIWADGKQIWRIFENLLNNIAKYAMANTRVYIDLKMDGMQAVITFKNMSEYALNISVDELTERFTRGDESRSTEGSGLGLSIAKNLTELQGGLFEIYLDGDLFKVTVAFERQNIEKTLN